MNNIIFTCIVNGYDELKEIKLEPGWRAICFTNTDIKSNSWEIVKINGGEKICREIKIMPFGRLPEHDKSVWIDGNLEIKVPLSQFVAGKEGFWLMTHPDRDCVYMEGQRCIELKKDDEQIIKNQMYRYLLEGYPHKNGLSATGVIVRDNTKKNKDFSFLWWLEVEGGSRRDQLSFNYVAYKFGLQFNMFPFLEGFDYHYHIPKLEALKKRQAEKEARRKRGIYRGSRITQAGQDLLNKQNNDKNKN